MTKTEYNEKYIKAIEKQRDDLVAYIQELERERDRLAESYHSIKVDCASAEGRIQQLESRAKIDSETIGVLTADNARLRKSLRESDERYRALLAKVQSRQTPATVPANDGLLGFRPEEME